MDNKKSKLEMIGEFIGTIGKLIMSLVALAILISMLVLFIKS